MPKSDSGPKAKKATKAEKSWAKAVEKKPEPKSASHSGVEIDPFVWVDNDDPSDPKG